MSARIRGQEVEILMIANGVPLVNITDVRSFEMSFQLETQTEGYLGETTNRKDSIFNGIRGRLELHYSDQEVFQLIQTLVDKARRRTPGAVINIKATLNFANGDRPRVLIPNVEFGEVPLSFGSRTDYGTISLDFEASEANVLL